MVASVPEETKRTFWMLGTRRTTRSASSTSAAQGAPYEVPRSAAWVMASITDGCACPRISGPQDPM